MKKYLIQQAVYLPILYFGTVIIASLFASDYSQIRQHVSELAINKNQLAVTSFTVGIFITGASAISFGIGLLLKFKRQFSITASLIMVFGITFLFGAFYKIGSPWHGLYGIGLSIMMLPFAFLYEMGKENINKMTKNFSIITALIIFLYFWAMVARLDPMEQRGLTQRVFGIFVFGFISYSAYKINKLAKS
ncbi:DUF998 domain-containing protein [uncultured Sunxiuqinia sp.]|uniref:DUF998 domain-containing protein n=1 Tax=uncultured Sunxiuqinia sp. TaxID=1573825 RepID=UPI0030D723C0|tara:strand:- start:20155 stop:20727 length:573 start_codon:yes stop_codon:yes gene_type:complete